MPKTTTIDPRYRRHRAGVATMLKTLQASIDDLPAKVAELVAQRRPDDRDGARLEETRDDATRR